MPRHKKVAGSYVIPSEILSIQVPRFMKISLPLLKLQNGHDLHTKNFKGAYFRKKYRWNYGSFYFLCTSSDDLLYLHKGFKAILEGFKVIERTLFSDEKIRIIL